jgi:hypothetical protein
MSRGERAEISRKRYAARSCISRGATSKTNTAAWFEGSLSSCTY